MSHISYAFNHSDIEATAYALTVLPRLGLSPRMMSLALQAAKLIILGDIEVDATTRSECKSQFFTINKLLSVFEKQLLQE